MVILNYCPALLTTALVKWNALHVILDPGGVADIVCHNAPDEYIRPCSCYFTPEWGLLEMTQHYTNESQNRSRLFAGRERSSLRHHCPFLWHTF